jgi:hypothetical protein
MTSMQVAADANGSVTSPKPQVHCQFSVTSGSFCYGELHNIWHGASSPVQAFPVSGPQPAGTILCHHLDYHVSAENGTWSAFHLVDLQTSNVRAWFSCHSDVDPEVEIDRILRVSGSPYEDGTRFNCDSTAEQGVLVVNRYDWGYYDKRGRDGVPETVSDNDGDGVGPEGYGVGVGLVDFANAREQVLNWKGQNEAEKHQTPAGVWMYIPNSEYMFGRFGFNEAHTAAKSFVFFSADTEFAKSAFVGLSRPLREAISE